jgi:hypothetical protein
LLAAGFNCLQNIVVVCICARKIRLRASYEPGFCYFVTKLLHNAVLELVSKALLLHVLAIKLEDSIFSELEGVPEWINVDIH